MSKAVHFRMLPRQTAEKEEVVLFSCLERPCKSIGVRLNSDQLKPHALDLHKSSKVKMDIKAMGKK